MLSQIANKLRAQIHHFSGKLSIGLCKPARRFVEEMVYGIQAKGSLVLTEIGRSLEEDIPLKKTVNRLSDNIDRPELRHTISEAILQEGSHMIKDDSLLIVDLTDIQKKYGKKMEFLDEVRDSSSEKKTIGPGYMMCTVVGAECGEPHVVPLYQSLYSTKAPNFRSENREILTAVGKTARATDRRGIFVIDRGGDRRKIYKWIVPQKHNIRFIIRQRGDRHVLHKGRMVEMLKLAYGCNMLYDAVFYKDKDGKETKYYARYGFKRIKLPEHPDVPLWLVVVKGFGKTPMMLLTNIPLRRKRSLLLWIIEAFVTRWRIEDTNRYIKQSYQLEDVRVRTYRRLQNMMVLLLAAVYFAAVCLGRGAKLRILALNALRSAKRLFGIPDFFYYAIADGIKHILTRSSKGLLYARGSSAPETSQLSLFPGPL